MTTTRDDTAMTPDQFTRSGMSDWFERWPDFLGRHWPEAFRPMAMWGESILLEQFTEDDGTLVLRAELPGVNADDDLDVTVEDGRLTITGSREERDERKEKGMYRSEFRYGSFSRTVRLPAGARTDAIEGSYDDGILEVRIPVDDDAEGVTTVPISTS